MCRMIINRLVSENITSGVSVECFPILFGVFLEILGFFEKNHFFPFGTVYKGTQNLDFWLYRLMIWFNPTKIAFSCRIIISMCRVLLQFVPNIFLHFNKHFTYAYRVWKMRRKNFRGQHRGLIEVQKSIFWLLKLALDFVNIQKVFFQTSTRLLFLLVEFFLRIFSLTLCICKMFIKM